GFEQVAVAIHGHLKATVASKVWTVFGSKPASIQHDTAKWRRACQLNRLGGVWCVQGVSLSAR
ncbi:MAG TPA: hypothetical protein VGC56_02315, partial [Allosphingosinicella sp.]